MTFPGLALWRMSPDCPMPAVPLAGGGGHRRVLHSRCTWWRGQWVYGRAGYRCRHGHTSTRRRDERVSSVYWVERRILNQLLYSLSYQGELPLFAGVDDLLNHLQTRDLVIICDVATLSLDPPTNSSRAGMS